MGLTDRRLPRDFSFLSALSSDWKPASLPLARSLSLLLFWASSVGLIPGLFAPVTMSTRRIPSKRLIIASWRPIVGGVWCGGVKTWLTSLSSQVALCKNGLSGSKVVKKKRCRCAGYKSVCHQNDVLSHYFVVKLLSSVVSLSHLVFVNIFIYKTKCCQF